MAPRGNGKQNEPRRNGRCFFNKHAKSGLTIKNFCRREDLVQSTFKRWQQNLGEKTPAQFVDLSPAVENVVSSSWELAVTLPNGVHLQF